MRAKGLWGLVAVTVLSMIVVMFVPTLLRPVGVSAAAWQRYFHLGEEPGRRNFVIPIGWFTLRPPPTAVAPGTACAFSAVDDRRGWPLTFLHAFGMDSCKTGVWWNPLLLAIDFLTFFVVAYFIAWVASRFRARRSVTSATSL